MAASKETEKFPYEKFPYRLEYQDGKDRKICWFECEEHLTKYITRYKLNDVGALVEVSDGRVLNVTTPKKKKSKQNLFSSLDQFFTSNETNKNDVAVVGKSPRAKSKRV